MMSQSQILQNHQNYAVWSHHPPPNPAVFPRMPAFTTQPRPPLVNHPGRVNWNRNQPGARKNFRRRGYLGSGSGIRNPADSQLPAMSRSIGKPRRFHHYKRRFSGRGGGPSVTPFAPRNTTSFLIRAKKSGGVSSLVSPCAATPAILPMPVMSPSTEEVVKMAKEEWGIDHYGSMKGLIRLRTDKEDSNSDPDADSDEIGGGGDDDGVNEHMEFEKRLDQDLSRFEMIYPNSGDERLGNRVDGQGLQIAHLEEQNLTLKERIFLIERELGDLRRRIIYLETDGFCGDAGDACSEKSVGNYPNHDGDKNNRG